MKFGVYFIRVLVNTDCMLILPKMLSFLTSMIFILINLRLTNADDVVRSCVSEGLCQIKYKRSDGRSCPYSWYEKILVKY